MECLYERMAALQEVVAGFEEIEFAILFGSAVTGRLREDSDLDVAVYLASGGLMEIEVARSSEMEPLLQLELERASDRNVDLLILNRAPATICSAALLHGFPVAVRNRSLYSRYFLAVTTVAIDFLASEREFRRIRARSGSLSELDRERLERILDFVAEELWDRERFRSIDALTYRSDRDVRRNLDRWVEMLINSAIDIGKLVLASEHRPVPRTYAQILADLRSICGFEQLGDRLLPLAALRNILAHEYLDLRFGRVHGFVDQGAEIVTQLEAMTRAWMDRNEDSTEPEL